MALIVLAPTLLLLMTEACLRLAHYGYPTGFLLKDPATGMFYSNDKFVWQFYSPSTELRPEPFMVPAKKPAGTIRIVVLGESAAVGTPDPAYGFGRILERLLRQQYPHTQFQVINAAIRGINSHVILPIARDCTVIRPDLFIAYMGNNEIVGLYAPGPHAGFLTPYLHVLRAIQWIKTTRVGELMSGWIDRLTGGKTPGNQDMVFFRNHRLAADDRRREAVYRNFRANLDAICRVARRAGAQLILSTVAVNLKDSPPFGSVHRADLTGGAKVRWDDAYAKGVAAEDHAQFARAIAHYREAARIDDHFADLHFRLGRCYLATSDWARARREYLLARDWDALQFRCDSRLNRIIRQVASAQHGAGVRLVDAARAFANSPRSDHGIPGGRLFYEHAHLTFDGDYLLARTVYPAVVRALTGRLVGPVPNQPLLSRDDCAASLAFTRLNQAQIRASMVEAMTQPPFLDQLDHGRRVWQARQKLNAQYGSLDQADVRQAIDTYQTALRNASHDWELHYNFARLFFTLHRYPAAIQQFQSAARLMPYDPSITIGRSAALTRLGKFDDALDALRKLLARDPGCRAALNAIAAVNAARAGQP